MNNYVSIESKKTILEDLILHFELEETRKKLFSYSTYNLLETAQKLYIEKKIDKDILIYIAYKHYKKMQYNKINTKIINEFIQQFPEVEYYNRENFK